ncbi:MAG: hypothetical protein AAF841_00195 [Pseudomonadota bacterium]
MSPQSSHWIAAALAALLAATFALLVRLPLPFPGFSIAVAASLAALGTFAFVAWMPPRWVWTDVERITQAFQARHGLGEGTAKVALDAITKSHARADSLRRSARAMREDVAADVEALADRLDAAAREIFYNPAQQRKLRGVLVRAQLIEDAATAHAALRARGHGETEEASRQKLRAAISALNAAFDETDLLAARGLLQEVDVASSVAERLLAPKKKMAAARAPHND